MTQTRPAVGAITSVARTATRTATAAVVVVALLAALQILGINPAASQDADAAIDLTAITTGVIEGQEFVVEFRILGPTEDRSIEVALHDPLGAREQLHVELASGPVGDVRRVIGPLPLATLASGSGAYRFTVDTSLPDLDLEPGQLYPVQLALRSPNGDLEDRVVVYLVLQSANAPRQPLSVAVVVPFSAPPMLQANGTSAIDPNDRRQLEAAAETLSSTAGIALSIDATPETVVGLLQSGDTRDSALVREVLLTLDRREVLAAPFVDLDVESWIRGGATGNVAEQVNVGTAAVQAALQTEPTAGTWLVRDTVSAATLTELAGLGLADRIVVPAAEVVPIQTGALPVSDGQRFELIDGNDLGHDALVADQAIQSHFGRSGSPVLDSHHLLADLGLIATAAPGVARGVIVVPPPAWVIDADILIALIRAIDNSGQMLATTVTDLFSHASTLTLASDPDGPILRRELIDSGTSVELPLSAQRAEAQNDVVSRQDLVPGTSETEFLQRLLLVSASADLNETEQLAYLDAIGAQVDADTSAITTTNPDRITLSARSGPIPITLRNDASYAIQVLLTVASDKLEFPEGASRELLLEPGVTDLVMAVEARTSGDATLDVVVTSPDRGLELHRSRVIVRSTALSGVGLVIAAIALAFLLVWWLRNLRSNQRDERLLPTEAPAGDRQSDPDIHADNMQVSGANE